MEYSLVLEIVLGYRVNIEGNGTPLREPGRHSTLDKGHEEGGSAYTNAGSSLRSPPGCSPDQP